jgi:hypothetical protein
VEAAAGGEPEPDPEEAVRRALAFGDGLQAHLDAERLVHARISSDLAELERRAAVWEILTRHFAAGTRSWSEVFDLLSEEEWAALARLVGDRDLAKLLAPADPPAVAQQPPGRRRRRWAGTAHRPLPVVTTADDPQPTVHDPRSR